MCVYVPRLLVLLVSCLYTVERDRKFSSSPPTPGKESSRCIDSQTYLHPLYFQRPRKKEKKEREKEEGAGFARRKTRIDEDGEAADD